MTNGTLDQLQDQLNVEPSPDTETGATNPQEPEQEQAPPAPILETAFIVYMDPNGHWQVATDIHAAAEMQIMRPSNVDDIFSGCSTLIKDIEVQQSASTAVVMLQRSGAMEQAFKTAMQELAEKAKQAQISADIAKMTGTGAIDLSKLR